MSRDEHRQRLKNLTLFQVYATDEQMRGSGCLVLAVLTMSLVVALVGWLAGWW